MKGILRILFFSALTWHVKCVIHCPLDNAPVPKPEDCTIYYNCTAGTPVLTHCPTGLYWNCFNRNCEKDVWNSCCMEDTNVFPKLNTNCSIEGVKIINPYGCGTYFVCENGTINDGMCGYGEIFNSTIHGCIPTNTGKCAPTTIDPIKVTESKSRLNFDTADMPIFRPPILLKDSSAPPSGSGSISANGDVGPSAGATTDPDSSSVPYYIDPTVVYPTMLAETQLPPSGSDVNDTGSNLIQIDPIWVTSNPIQPSGSGSFNGGVGSSSNVGTSGSASISGTANGGTANGGNGNQTNVFEIPLEKPIFLTISPISASGAGSSNNSVNSGVVGPQLGVNSTNFPHYIRPSLLKPTYEIYKPILVSAAGSSNGSVDNNVVAASPDVNFSSSGTNESTSNSSIIPYYAKLPVIRPFFHNFIPLLASVAGSSNNINNTVVGSQSNGNIDSSGTMVPYIGNNLIARPIFMTYPPVLASGSNDNNIVTGSPPDLSIADPIFATLSPVSASGAGSSNSAGNVGGTQPGASGFSSGSTNIAIPIPFPPATYLGSEFNNGGVQPSATSGSGATKIPFIANTYMVRPIFMTAAPVPASGSGSSNGDINNNNSGSQSDTNSNNNPSSPISGTGVGYSNYTVINFNQGPPLDGDINSVYSTPMNLPFRPIPGLGGGSGDVNINSGVQSDGNTNFYATFRPYILQYGSFKPHSSNSLTQSSICKSNTTIIPNTKNCHEYFKCYKSKIYRESCAPNKNWNCFSKRCEKNAFTACCKNDPNPPKKSSNRCYIIGKKIPNPTNCTKYYQCSLSLKIVGRTCPKGQKFDWIQLKCVVASTAKCEPVITVVSKITPAKPTTTTPTTTSPPTTTTPIPTTVWNPATCGQEGMKLPNINNCRNYYQCTNDQSVLKTCSIFKRYFNCWKNACDYFPSPHCCDQWLPVTEQAWCSVIGVLNSDPDSCNNYYECVDNVTIKKVCDNDMVFDVWLQKCMLPTEGRCGWNPDVSTCNAYDSGTIPMGSISSNTIHMCPNE